MKNNVCLFMAVLVVAAFPICALSAPYSGGDGSSGNPYQIATVADLQQLSITQADWSRSFILTADINLAGQTFIGAVIAPDTDTDDETEEFLGTPFAGFFDGNGHVISNLTITASTLDFIGLFGAVGTGGQVKNLGIENVNITGRNYVGGLIGYNDAALTGCHVTGSVNGCSDVGGMMGRNGTGMLASCYAAASITANINVGGLMGGNVSGSLTSCYATGSVSGTDYDAGGLVGWIYDGTLTDCYATGSVSGNSGVGGMVGGCEGEFGDGGTLTGCYATGPVIATGSTAGGLVGFDYSCTLTDCYATGSVSGTVSVGGLLGWGNFGPLTNCYATGKVTATSSYAGGLVGRNWATLTDCSASGSVIGCSWAGGLVGYNYGTLISCDSSSSVSGTDNVGGLVGENHNFPITSCYATGSVGGDNQVGGLAGYNYNGSLTNCYATGSARATSSEVGGLIGNNTSTSGTLTSCYATGSASGTKFIGGLVGHNWGTITLTSCYATGSVSGTFCVAGLLGWNAFSSLTDCYATGLVNGAGSNIGGLVGGDSSGTFTGCFWDINTSRTNDGVGNVDPDPAGVTGQTTAQMMTLSTFTDAGWDFSATDGDPADWMMLRPGQDYPRLAWQTITGDIAGSYGVNFVDFAVFAAHWDQTGCPSGCENADLNNNGTVDIDDLTLFADNWLKGI